MSRASGTSLTESTLPVHVSIAVRVCPRTYRETDKLHLDGDCLCFRRAVKSRVVVGNAVGLGVPDHGLCVADAVGLAYTHAAWTASSSKQELAVCSSWQWYLLGRQVD
jgi:hypothetical protein